MHPSKQPRLSSFGLSFLLIFIFASTVAADTVDVSIAGFAFDPDSLVVEVGTHVRWTNNDGVPHTSTSDSPYWDSGTLSNGQEFIFLFEAVGYFPYHCEIHPSMLASVTVKPVSRVPSLNEYGLLILAFMLILTAIIVYRRKIKSVKG